MPSHESSYGTLFKFDKDDLFINRIKTYPKSEFFIYTGSVYYGNIDNRFANQNTPAGHTNLYELNVDRFGELIHPFIEKRSSFTKFSTISESDFQAALPGDKLLGSPYPYTAGITFSRFNAVKDESQLRRIYALRNSLDHYTALSPHYTFDYQDRPETSLIDNKINLVQIPSIFYGSSIRKGSVKLKYYITGSLIAEASDIYKNGVLYQTSGTTNLNQPIGVVLYNEGFLLITSSVNLGDDASTTDIYSADAGGDAVRPQWQYFGTTDAHTRATASAFDIEFDGVNYVETLTMLAHAEKNKLNFSNNPTFITGTIAGTTASNNVFKENDKIGVKNIVSSSYKNYSASFEPVTYISKIGIYDKDKNLIAIASLANPVKKKQDLDYTFKLKLDI